MSLSLLRLCVSWPLPPPARVCGPSGRGSGAGAGSRHVAEDVADGPPARDGPGHGREAHHLRVAELARRLDGVLAAVAGVLGAAAGRVTGLRVRTRCRRWP